MHSETTVIYRDADGRAYEKAEDAARSNLGKRLFALEKANPSFFLSKKPNKEGKNDPLMFLMEVVMLTHWIETNPEELEALIRQWLTESRADKPITQP